MRFKTTPNTSSGQVQKCKFAHLKYIRKIERLKHEARSRDRFLMRSLKKKSSKASTCSEIIKFSNLFRAK